MPSVFAKLTEEQKRLPENALSGMTVAEGLQVELFAAEPLITNPTNISVDHLGRVWACEAYNYDVAPDKADPQGDKIVMLEDTDGDGKADKRTVFYQGEDVNTALGIMVLGNTVYVSRSPNILLLTDTDGDGVADQKDTLFTGIGRKGDHSVHAMFPGPDGKLYFNMGNYGKEIRDKSGKLVVDLAGNEVTSQGKPYHGGMVFRCNPDGSQLEVLGHNFRNNYEATIDSYGNLWQSDNDDDGNRSSRINFILDYGNYGYQDEMTGAAWAVGRVNLEDSIPQRHWHANDPGSVPNVLITGAGSPAGIALYEGDLLPAQVKGQPVHAEPYYNVVRAYLTRKKGAGYTASVFDILQSEDQWFRPVDVCTAPDGSLFIADWYDPIVGGGAAGDADRGRIYRVAPKVRQYQVPAVNLETVAGAVEALQSPNKETQFLAGQSLQRHGAAARPALEGLWQGEEPMLRARALWLLGRLEEDKYLREALQDPNPDLRIQGIRMVRQSGREVVPYLQLVLRDPEPAVRREAAIALRFAGSPQAAEAWVELARQYDGQDRWYLEALGIGADRHPDQRLEAWLKNGANDLSQKVNQDIIWRSRSAKALPLLADLIRQAPNTAATLRYFRAFDFHADPAKQQVLASLVGLPGENNREITALALQQMDGKQAKLTPRLRTALEESLNETKGTLAFVQLVEKFDLRHRKADLLDLALQHPQDQVGATAVKLLLSFGESRLIRQGLEAEDPKTRSLLTALNGNSSKEALALVQEVLGGQDRSLEVRKAAVLTLGSTWPGEERLLAAVKNPDFPDELKPVAGSVLFSVYRSALQREAAQYLPKPEAAGGSLPPIKELVALAGHPENGKAVFTQSCGTCHVARGEGTPFGPELSQVGSKLSREGLYTAIIHPDAGISYGYEGHLLKLKDGTAVMGIVASETGQALEVLQIGGTRVQIDKAQVVERQKQERSLMPSLVAGMSQQELVDLVAYLSSLK